MTGADLELLVQSYCLTYVMLPGTAICVEGAPAAAAGVSAPVQRLPAWWRRQRADGRQADSVATRSVDECSDWRHFTLLASGMLRQGLDNLFCLHHALISVCPGAGASNARAMLRFCDVVPVYRRSVSFCPKYAAGLQRLRSTCSRRMLLPRPSHRP